MSQRGLQCGRNAGLRRIERLRRELFWAATHGRRASYPPQAAAGLVRHLATFNVIAPPRESVVAAVQRATASGMPVWDALIVEAAAVAGARIIYSEDQHLHKAAENLGRGVRAIDPFAEI